MKDSSTSPPHGTRTLVAVFAVGMLMCLLVVVSIYHGNLISSRHPPLIDAAMEIKLEATTAHLWFEEILSGDRHESIDAVWAHLDQADWYAGAMLDGGHNQKGRFRPLEEPELRRQLTEVRGKLAQFQRITRERLAARLKAWSL